MPGRFSNSQLVGLAGQVCCILISPLMEGAEGFMFMYFHLQSFGIRVVPSFIVCLIWVCNVLVGSVVAVWKLLLSMKFCILVS